MADEAEASIKGSEAHVSDPASLSKPLHIQRLEHLLRLDSFLNYIEKEHTYASSEDELSEPNVNELNAQLKDNNKFVNGILTTRLERKSDRLRVYNLSKVRRNRKWLKNVLLSESSSDEDEDVTEEELKQMLKYHVLKKRCRVKYHSDHKYQQYQYYSAGLLSNTDKFAEHQRAYSKKKNRKDNSDKKVKASKLRRKKMKSEMDNLPSDAEGSYRQLDSSMMDENVSSPSSSFAVNNDDAGRTQSPVNSSSPSIPTRHSKKDKKPVTEAMLNMRRRRLWVAICKKEISRAQKQKISAHKEVLASCKKMAQGCLKEVRKEALLSQKTQKDTPGRCKRLSREMILYWKRFDKVEKEHRKKAEKEAQEQLKLDIELREAKRQQRKLNFLITQTELYAHFMSRKMTGEKESKTDDILNQLDENKESNVDNLLLRNDDYDSELVKTKVVKNVENAYNHHLKKTCEFSSRTERTSPEDNDLNKNFKLTDPSLSTKEEIPQPQMFVGKLKSYQLKGMNWLYQLYNNGINGILADEMGLGKTVQSISFLAHIAETLGIWGPFLVIAPASTLHNWQQEFTRFTPNFKVLPYWGNAADRKIIRKFWDQKDMHTEKASFYVLITSYQLIIQDVKYFQRIKWQYMILDEAQALKSSSSVRWKLLLGFNCRNRLLLTGTPIQNSMAELWALLHFIMPTMFDSHQEFNEWFSKDIESHAENRSVIDEKHLSRLHMILKPFMLRRIKKDVENELSDKIEILKYCYLTRRQKHLYQGLKNKISIEDLFNSSSSSVSSSQVHIATSSLMNLVIQFRKVCNHPELFERREVRLPFCFSLPPYRMSKFLYRNVILSDDIASRRKLKSYTLGIFHPHHIHSALEGNSSSDDIFSFLPFVNSSPSELSSIFLRGLLARWLSMYITTKSAYQLFHQYFWHTDRNQSVSGRLNLWIVPERSTYFVNRESSDTMSSLLFTSFTSTVYAHLTHTLCGTPETEEHWKHRHRKRCLSTSTSQGSPKKINSPTELPVFVHKMRSPCIFNDCPTEVPSFLLQTFPKVVAKPTECFCSDSDAAWKTLLHSNCGSNEGLTCVSYGNFELAENWFARRLRFFTPEIGGILGATPRFGWSRVIPLDKEMLVTDSGKLKILDCLLARLKQHGHRVLIYSQMTRMIDILEEYMWHRKHTYIRLDGSSKISDRRDMVADFQTRSDIFVFLLSTRAGGLGINLTAADTVIFYDSDWNPTVDQQAMDRAHRLGQTKQVTVYRLICKGTIEERILQRAREKSEIQRMVISGGNFKPDTLKPKEVVSLLLDDEEMERKLWLRQEERLADEVNGERKRKRKDAGVPRGKRKKNEEEQNWTIPASGSMTSHLLGTYGGSNVDTDSAVSVFDSIPPSPYSERSPGGSLIISQDDTSNEGSLVVDDCPPIVPTNSNSSSSSSPSSFGGIISSVAVAAAAVAPSNPKSKTGRGTGRRGRPKGSSKKGPGAASGGVNGGCGRGRGANVMSAAEIAGAQAGRSAAYAAYGYQLGSAGDGQFARRSASGSTNCRSRVRGSLLRHRRGGVGRGSSKKLLYDRLTNPPPKKSSADDSGPVTDSPPITMGFYTQN